MRTLKVSPEARPAPYTRAPRKRAASVTPKGWLSHWRLASGLVLAIGFGVGGYHAVRSGIIDAAVETTEQHLADSLASAGFVVREINVVGRRETAPEDLLAAVGLRRGQPILFFDALAARQRVEQIPWVQKATIQRVLPDTIIVNITERRPFARWQIEGKQVLVDIEGKVLMGGHVDEFRMLRRVVGPGAGDKAKALFDLLALEPDLESRVRDGIRVRERRWDLEFDNGVTVSLPEENPEFAWRHLAQMQREKRILERAVTLIDFRLPDRTVVRLSPETQAVQNPSTKKSGGRAT